MTDINELFETIAKIIGNRPKTGVITDYDKIRAVQVFLAFDEFLINNLPAYCEEAYEFDFGAYDANVIGEIEGND